MSSSTATHLRKNIAAISLIAAPILLLTGDLIELVSGPSYPRYLLMKSSFAVFVAAVLGLMHLLRERADRIGIIGGGLAIVGCMAGATIVTFVLFERTVMDAALDAATLQSIQKVMGQIGLSVVLIPLPGLGFPIGLILLSVGLYRTRVVARLIAGLLALGAFLFPLGRIPGILPVELASDVLLVVAMGLTGWQILGWSVKEWELVRAHTKEEAPLAGQPLAG